MQPSLPVHSAALTTTLHHSHRAQVPTFLVHSMGSEPRQLQLIALFSGSASKQVCISCMCGADLCCSSRGCVLSSHTVFIGSRVSFRAGNIIYYAEQTISNQQMASCSSLCTVCSLAEAGQVKCAAHASLYMSSFFLTIGIYWAGNVIISF